MTDNSPILLWFRRDLRLSDHPALTAAVATGRPVIPVFVHDPLCGQLGAAARWRLGLAVAHFSNALSTMGGRLILRRGEALSTLRDLIAETGAGAVYWTRQYDPSAIARDTGIKQALTAQGCLARSFGGQLLFEPASVETGQGGPYRVYSPFWRAVRGRAVDALLPPPRDIRWPQDWPAGDALTQWDMGGAMRRGAAVVAPHLQIGEAAAASRLDAFVDQHIARYKDARDFPARSVTSGLSENLTYGEISPHRLWHAGQRALDAGAPGAEHFLKEVTWREFAWHLAYHTPDILTDPWRADWRGFPWDANPDNPHLMAWQRGRTGVPIVDAGMRQLYVTGVMHNRVRMIAASYLTKHLGVDWRLGQAWFAQTLVDWDAASNAMGWQWVAGCGPDAAPYFRIFNPETQAQKFDPDGIYRQRWIAEGNAPPTDQALSFFRAVPLSWAMSPQDDYPAAPIVGLPQGRARALAAYEAWRSR